MSNKTYEKTLVIGGGIGGLSAAIALSQAGCAVDLVEIKPAWTHSGVGIIQPSNALRALAGLGVADACLAAGFGYNAYRYCNAAGGDEVVVPGPRIAGEHVPAYNGIVRGKLHAILLARARQAGVAIRLGTTVQSLEQDAQHATVQLSDGSRAAYDLVIAADGIYSPMRQRLFGESHVPRATGQSVWRISMPRDPELTDGLMVNGSRTKAGYIPLAPDLMYLLLVTHEAPDFYAEPGRMHELLLDRLREFGGFVERTKRHITADADIVYRPLEVVMLSPPWHQGRVIVIGDAAHASTPHLGQGAAMAIEDAVVVGELAARELAVAELGSEFMRRRYERARLIQTASLTIGEYELGRRPELDLHGLIRDAKDCAAQPI